MSTTSATDAEVLLKRQTADGVLILTLNDPATRNALGPDTAEAVLGYAQEAAAEVAAQKAAERMDEGHIVCLLADGGWKYLSSGLWSNDYDAIEEQVSTKFWW